MFAFAVLAFAILLPIVPSYLLFKALPSTATITGKLQGKQIKLGGAFAGYICVLFIMMHYHNLWSPYEVWQFSGQIVDPTGAPIQDVNPNDVLTQPLPVQTPGAGMFSLTLTTSTGIGGQTQYPIVVVSHPGYLEQVISLDPNSPQTGVTLTRDSTNDTITASKIVLQPMPAYNANATPLNAAPATPAAGGGK